VSSNFDSSEWTAYDGDLPAYDYVMEFDAPNQEYDPVWRTSYHLGLAQREADDGQGGPGPTRYFHTDHLGTTRGMSDEGAVGPPPEPVTVSPRLVYTAFGELVASTGPDGSPITPDTRYGYVGSEGYETFGEFTADTPFPFVHVGIRWYDPSCGRFLQRDPLGANAGPNVYAYAGGRPVSAVDPDGLQYYPVNPTPGGPWLPPPPNIPGQDGHRLYPDGWRPHLPGWKPSFSLTPRVFGACALAFTAGYATGTIIDKSVEVITGKSVSDRVGEWIYRKFPSAFAVGL